MKSEPEICLVCAIYGERRRLVPAVVPHLVEVAGVRFTGELAVGRCPACKQVSDTEQGHAFDLLVAEELGRRWVMTGEAVRFLRRVARLETSGLARLLDVTRQTVSRWESDASPIDRASFVVLWTLARERGARIPELRQHLETEAVATPREIRMPPGKTATPKPAARRARANR